MLPARRHGVASSRSRLVMTSVIAGTIPGWPARSQASLVRTSPASMSTFHSSNPMSFIWAYRNAPCSPSQIVWSMTRKARHGNSHGASSCRWLKASVRSCSRCWPQRRERYSPLPSAGCCAHHPGQSQLPAGTGRSLDRPRVPGEDAGHTICVRCRAHCLLEFGKACGFLRPNIAMVPSRLIHRDNPMGEAH